MTRYDWTHLILLSLLFGSSFFFVALAVEHVPPLAMALARTALAAATLAALLVLTGRGWPRGGRVWLALATMGLVNNAVPFTLIAIAQGGLASGVAAILNATAPLWAVLIALLVGIDERLSLRRAAGVAVGFFGVVTMVGAAALAEGVGTVVAALCSLGAALAYAVSGLWGRRLAGMGVAPLPGAFGQTLCAALLLAPVVMLVDRPWALDMPPASALLALAGLGLLSTGAGYVVYYRLLASAGAVNLMLVNYLIPITALALGVGLLGEALALRHLAGMALIALGLALADGRAMGRLRAGLARRRANPDARS